MTTTRVVRTIVIAMAAMAYVAACGDKEATPGDTSATPETAAPSAPVVQAGTGAATPRIVFFDRETALQASNAGKSMIQQVQALRTRVQQELMGEGRRLEADARAFQQQSAILSAGAKAAKQRELQNRQAALQRKVQARTEQIQAGFRKALDDFSNRMRPILDAIMKERNANLMLDRSVILMAPPESMEQFDITRLAVQRINQSVTTIKVELVTAPARPATAPGAPAAPAVPVAPAGQ